MGYVFGTVFAVFAVVCRYLIWLRRPPTARLNRRGWEAFRRPGRRGRNAAALPGLVVSNLVLRSFTRARRSTRRRSSLIVSLGIFREPHHLAILMVAVALLVVQGVAINRLAGIPYPLWSPRPPAA